MKAAKFLPRILMLTLYGSSFWLAARAADVSGQWRAEFDTQVGQQKYLFTFQMNEGKPTGKAAAELGDQKRNVEFKEVKLTDDTLTFVEMFKFQDNDVRIDYTGKLSDNEIKFTRKVSDFATEEFVAKRVEAAATNIAATNRAPRGPGRFGGPIVLGPDDKPAFPDPPVRVRRKTGRYRPRKPGDDRI